GCTAGADSAPGSVSVRERMSVAGPRCRRSPARGLNGRSSRCSAWCGDVYSGVRASSSGKNPVAPGVALRAVFVVDDPLGRGVRAEEPQHLVADDAEAVRHLGRDGDRVALAERHLAVLAAVDPRFGDAIEDVQDLHVGMRVDGRHVTGLRGLDARANRRGPLVIAEDQLIDRVRPELHELGLREANHLQLVHGSLPHPYLSAACFGKVSRRWGAEASYAIIGAWR